MSYLKREYKIIPKDSYKVIRKCSKCGSKTSFVNTNKFRVNANGNQIDVWLIYQCEHCKHTYNLSIYERVKPSCIPAEEYKRYLANDEELAMECGNNKALFARNRAEIDIDQISYTIFETEGSKADNCIIIKNSYDMKIRIDKVLSEILSIPRSQVKQFRKDDLIQITNHYDEKSIHVTIRSLYSIGSSR